MEKLKIITSWNACNPFFNEKISSTCTFLKFKEKKYYLAFIWPISVWCRIIITFQLFPVTVYRTNTISISLKSQHLFCSIHQLDHVFESKSKFYTCVQINLMGNNTLFMLKLYSKLNDMRMDLSMKHE